MEPVFQCDRAAASVKTAVKRNDTGASDANSPKRICQSTKWNLSHTDHPWAKTSHVPPKKHQRKKHRGDCLKNPELVSAPRQSRGILPVCTAYEPSAGYRICKLLRAAGRRDGEIPERPRFRFISAESGNGRGKGCHRPDKIGLIVRKKPETGVIGTAGKRDGRSNCLPAAAVPETWKPFTYFVATGQTSKDVIPGCSFCLEKHAKSCRRQNIWYTETRNKTKTPMPLKRQGSSRSDSWHLDFASHIRRKKFRNFLSLFFTDKPAPHGCRFCAVQSRIVSKKVQNKQA